MSRVYETEDRKLKVRELATGTIYSFWCPGCQCYHGLPVGHVGDQVAYRFNGDLKSPSFEPSLLSPGVPRCHVEVRAGTLVYLADCGHTLAGQTIPLPELP